MCWDEMLIIILGKIDHQILHCSWNEIIRIALSSLNRPFFRKFHETGDYCLWWQNSSIFYYAAVFDIAPSSLK